jgi:hypothetical protein
MTASPFLTIIVPTYNRADCLEVLLQTLRQEMAGLEDRVRVVVGDNASADRTAQVTAAFQAAWPAAQILRHERNVGPDENFCRCIDHVTTPFFWIIGDDDLPRAGALRLLLELLARHQPDLVYLESDWQPQWLDNDPGHPLRALEPLTLDRVAFARRVHVWSTFISGLVINRASFLSAHGAQATRRYSDTHLVQLGWVLGQLKTGRRFLLVPQKCVLATQGNTGGYKVLQVFGNNFPRIVADTFGVGSHLTQIIIRRCTVNFLPELLWGLRFAHVGSFTGEDPSTALRPQLGQRLGFRLLLLPIARLPRPLARMALGLARWSARMLRLHDQLRERLTGAAHPV